MAEANLYLIPLSSDDGDDDDDGDGDGVRGGDARRKVTEDGHRATGAGRALAAGRADSNLVEELRPWDRPSPSGPWHHPRPLATDCRRPSWRP